MALYLEDRGQHGTVQMVKKSAMKNSAMNMALGEDRERGQSEVIDQ